MTPDHRKALLGILSRLGQIETDANAILAEPADTDNLPLAEELRELVVEMQAQVEGKLKRIQSAEQT